MLDVRVESELGIKLIILIKLFRIVPPLDRGLTKKRKDQIFIFLFITVPEDHRIVFIFVAEKYKQRDLSQTLQVELFAGNRFEIAGSDSELGMQEGVDDLLDMAGVELEHELFFREKVTGHRLLPAMKKVFRWS